MRTIAVLTKELMDSLRDAKTIVTGMMFGLMGPIVVFYLVSIMAVASRAEGTMPVALCRPAEVPSLQAHLVAAGFEVVKKAEVCLEVPQDFEAQLARGRTVRVGIRADLTRPGPIVPALQRELRAFSVERAAQGLIARGVAPAVLSPVTIDTQSTNPVSKIADTFGAVVVIFFVLTPFIVAAGMAADLTAGERERRTLETLLTTPARPEEIVLGKFLAVSAFNLAGTALCVAVGLVILDRSALPDLGVRLNADPMTMLRVIGWLTPLSLLVAAIQIAIGLWSKGFKDAQNILMMLMFVPMSVGYASLGLTDAPGPWPVLWETSALAGPLLGSTAQTTSFPAAAAVELVLAGVLLLVSARRLRSERLLAQG